MFWVRFYEFNRVIWMETGSQKARRMMALIAGNGSPFLTNLNRYLEA
jgi:hypothetical protein